MNEENKSKFELRRYLYYFIIGIISLIAVVFLPMIGSEAGLGWNLPNTTVGWIVWATGRVIVAVINVLLFHSFMMQGKLNVKDHPKYVEARDILMKKSVKGYEPKSPAQFFGKKWRTKGITIAVSSLLSTVALTQAVLTFDYVTMLSYLFTIIMGVIFGVLTMKEVEDYYTGEYWQYAQRHKDEMKEKQEAEDNGNHN